MMKQRLSFFPLYISLLVLGLIALAILCIPQRKDIHFSGTVTEYSLSDPDYAFTRTLTMEGHYDHSILLRDEYLGVVSISGLIDEGSMYLIDFPKTKSATNDSVYMTDCGDPADLQSPVVSFHARTGFENLVINIHVGDVNTFIVPAATDRSQAASIYHQYTDEARGLLGSYTSHVVFPAILVVVANMLSVLLLWKKKYVFGLISAQASQLALTAAGYIYMVRLHNCGKSSVSILSPDTFVVIPYLFYLFTLLNLVNTILAITQTAKKR